MTRVTARLAELLGHVPYLHALEPGARRALAARCSLRTLRKGRTLFVEGAPAAGLWVIGRGRVKLVRVSARGREQVLHVEGAGATLAEVPVFDGAGYVATAVALEETEVAFVPRQPLLEICRAHPDVALGVIRTLAAPVRAFAALVEDLALRDVAGRVARLILDVEARRQGPDIDLPGTRDEIAARLGTVRELVSRSLARLARLGLVEVRGRRVRVVDRAGLAALGGVEAGRAAVPDPPFPERI